MEKRNENKIKQKLKGKKKIGLENVIREKKRQCLTILERMNYEERRGVRIEGNR